VVFRLETSGMGKRNRGGEKGSGKGQYLRTKDRQRKILTMICDWLGPLNPTGWEEGIEEGGKEKKSQVERLGGKPNDGKVSTVNRNAGKPYEQFP